MNISPILGWVGTTTGMLIGLPQLVKTIKTRKAGDLSATTFILILVTSSCLLARVVAIRELAFIFYYAFLISINSLQLFLIWKYKERNITA
jgi:uncharacterized protein with PQ loop repeat